MSIFNDELQKLDELFNQSLKELAILNGEIIKSDGIPYEEYYENEEKYNHLKVDYENKIKALVDEFNKYLGVQKRWWSFLKPDADIVTFRKKYSHDYYFYVPIKQNLQYDALNTFLKKSKYVVYRNYNGASNVYEINALFKNSDGEYAGVV